MTLGPSDRSPGTQARYQHDVDNELLIGLANEPAIVQHTHWKLIVNRYPYDARWSTSMLLVLNRECGWADLTDDEITDRHHLENQYLKVFDKVERNGRVMSSVHGVPHVHLLQGLKR